MNKEERKVTLSLTIDTKICPVLDYFEIFMDRTMMSKHAAKYLGLWFEVVINDTNLLQGVTKGEKEKIYEEKRQ